MKLVAFPDEIAEAAERRAPHRTAAGDVTSALNRRRGCKQEQDSEGGWASHQRSASNGGSVR